MRLTSDPGTDVNPVAATDAKGRVWVAWQGFRNNNLEILAAAQNGDSFSKEAIVSFSKRSDWDPAIAAAPNGEVAVAWDTYDKGDYDVYFRRLQHGRRDPHGSRRCRWPPAPNFEAEAPSPTMRRTGCGSPTKPPTAKWGKDFGAYETTGVALYQDHNIRS